MIDDGGNGDAHDDDEGEENFPSDEDKKYDEERAQLEPETLSNDVLSMITDDDNTEMIAQNRMFLQLLFRQQAEWKKDCNWMVAEIDHSQLTEPNEPTDPTQRMILKVVDHVWYCGGESRSDECLQSLWSNIDSHKHLVLKGGRDWVNYAIPFRDTWNNH